MPLSNRHADQIKEILIRGKMIPAFYDSLLTRVDNGEYAVAEFGRFFIKQQKIRITVERNNTKLTREDKNLLCNKYILSRFMSPMRGINLVNKLYDFTNKDLELMLPNNFCKFDSVLIAGCPFSTDIDMVLFIRQSDHNDGHVDNPLFSDEIDRLRQLLIEIGYESTLDMDYNLVYADPLTQRIIAVSKGTCEDIQQIANATWMLHEKQQFFPGSNIPLALKLHPLAQIDLDCSNMAIQNKLRAQSKHILNFAENICTKENYAKLRPGKKRAFNEGADAMCLFIEKMTPYIHFDPIMPEDVHLEKWQDLFKTITMKFIQIMLMFYQKRCLYTKEEFCESLRTLVLCRPPQLPLSDDNDEKLDNGEQHVDRVDDIVNGAYWYVFRGKRGAYYPELYPFFLKHYMAITKHLLSLDIYNELSFDKKELINLFNTSENKLIASLRRELSEEMFVNFLNSPIECTNEFETQWIERHGSDSLSEHFLIPSSNRDDFFSFAKTTCSEDVLRTFEQCILFSDQRTKEWTHDIRHKFVCGTHSQTLGEDFKSRYNLVRGCVFELLAMVLFNPNVLDMKRQFSKWNFGFIVERDIEGSSGFAPDLCLLSNEEKDNNYVVPEFIIVEIKGLKNFGRNGDYRRGLELATSQIKTGHIMSKFLGQNQLVMKRGIILLCAMIDGKFKMEIREIEI